VLLRAGHQTRSGTFSGCFSGLGVLTGARVGSFFGRRTGTGFFSGSTMRAGC
jgi:hypothetical protein